MTEVVQNDDGQWDVWWREDLVYSGGWEEAMDVAREVDEQWESGDDRGPDRDESWASWRNR